MKNICILFALVCCIVCFEACNGDCITCQENKTEWTASYTHPVTGVFHTESRCGDSATIANFLNAYEAEALSADTTLTTTKVGDCGLLVEDVCIDVLKSFYVELDTFTCY